MSFAELIKQRQSARSYLARPVEKEKIIRCLEAARLSPSANNSQPWKFIVVDDLGLRVSGGRVLGQPGHEYKFTYQGPVLVVIVLEKENILSSVGGMIKDKEFCHYDTGIAVNQFWPPGDRTGIWEPVS
jgi:nitroreductase